MKKIYPLLLTFFFHSLLLGQPTTNGLIARYSFTGKHSLLNDNHAAHHLTNNGTVTATAGIPDSAALFNGNNRLSAAHNDFMPGSISLAAWFKITGITQYATIAVARYNPTTAPYNSFNICTGSYTQNKVSFIFSTGSNYDVSITSTTVVQPDTWCHVIATYDETTGQAKLYINGNLEASHTLAVPESITYSNNMFAIGHVPLGSGNANGNGFIGAIDEVMFYNRALSASEIAAGPLVTGIVDHPSSPEVTLYPNPATHIVHLHSPVAGDLRLYDGAGRLVKTYNAATTINVEYLPEGKYFLRTQEGYSFTFIKTK